MSAVSILRVLAAVSAVAASRYIRRLAIRAALPRPGHSGRTEELST
jgi:hypothetical protein